jgi:AcrR family transcriptional regulator
MNVSQTKQGSAEAPRRAPLTRARIIEAAMHLMDAEGLEAVTMRRIGRELGVEAMSLYNHVRDKEDILEGVIEAVMAGFEFPEESPDWATNCRRAARAWRNVLKAHPNVVTIMSEQKDPPRSLESLRPLDYALGLLAQAGLEPDETVRAFHAFGGFIQGFVLSEIANVFGGEEHARWHEEVARSVPPDLLPNVAKHFPYLAHCDFDAEFEYGLDLMLRGLQAKIASDR